MSRAAAARAAAQDKPPRAVIDIGSNTVRLVIYAGSRRAPEVVWNESCAARLGRELSDTGRIPDEAAEEALAALARYALIIGDHGIEDVQTVATAATRDAENGADFLARVAALGLSPRQLSGEEEACHSALGAIGAFPGEPGVVADLGGGSLELVAIDGQDCSHAVSLPLGTLRLPRLRASGDLKKHVHAMLDGVGWAAAHPGPLYMVGGTWRAFAAYAMRQEDFPLTDPHGFRLRVSAAERMAKALQDAKPKRLAEIPGISAMRAGYLPDAAAMLRPLLADLAPDELVFSSWGIREGMLYARLDMAQRAKDPLLAGLAHFGGSREVSATDATLLAAWSVAAAEGGGQGQERLRLAAAWLSLALHRVEPNLRARYAEEWSLDKRWIGLDPRGRALVCAALLGSLGKVDCPHGLFRLAGDEDLREAIGWGLAFRLARRLGANSRMSLTASSLRRKDDRLELALEQARAPLADAAVLRDLAILADWLGLDPDLAIVAETA